MRDYRRVLTGAFFLLAAVVAAPSSAQVSLVGDWSSRVHEDPTRGRSAARRLHRHADHARRRWRTRTRGTSRGWTLQERQCVPHSATWAFRGPAQIRIWEEKDPTTQDVVAIKTFIATFAQTRTIWMDGRPHPGKYAPHTWQGFSTGKWNGNMLTVTTTHLKRFFHRRNGVPESDQVTLTEHFIRHGNNYLTHVMMAEDPVYLTEPMVQSQNFVLVNNVAPATYQTHGPASRDEEIAGREPGYVPHYLPGQRPRTSTNTPRCTAFRSRRRAPAPRRCIPNTARS